MQRGFSGVAQWPHRRRFTGTAAIHATAMGPGFLRNAEAAPHIRSDRGEPSVHEQSGARYELGMIKENEIFVQVLDPAKKSSFVSIPPPPVEVKEKH